MQRRGLAESRGLEQRTKQIPSVWVSHATFNTLCATRLPGIIILAVRILHLAKLLRCQINKLTKCRSGLPHRKLNKTGESTASYKHLHRGPTVVLFVG